MYRTDDIQEIGNQCSKELIRPSCIVQYKVRRENNYSCLWRHNVLFCRLQYVSGLDKYDTEKNVVLKQSNYVIFLSDCLQEHKTTKKTQFYHIIVSV